VPGHCPIRAAALVLLLTACVPPPLPAESNRATAETPASAPRARRAQLPDDCEQRPGQPTPAPLRTEYTGVARAARCDREVYTIMGGITHFLGVKCAYCHIEPDYAADTHNKRVANWMARELVPGLRQRKFALGETAEVWCQDCHAGKPKLLGNPRQRSLAIDWMTTHLVEDLDTRQGQPLKCKDCHQGDLGSLEFKPKLIFSDLTGLPKPESTTLSAPAASASVPAAPGAPAQSEVVPAPTAPDTPASPMPDFGPR
jgi:hypothetical protein